MPSISEKVGGKYQFEIPGEQKPPHGERKIFHAEEEVLAEGERGRESNFQDLFLFGFDDPFGFFDRFIHHLFDFFLGFELIVLGNFLVLLGRF